MTKGPRMQNIPVRSEDARRVSELFRPAVSLWPMAYTEIELHILRTQDSAAYANMFQQQPPRARDEPCECPRRRSRHRLSRPSEK